MDVNAAASRSLLIIGRNTGHETWLEERLQHALPRILPDLRTSAVTGQCPLSDVGEYVLGMLQVVSHFANTIAYGNFVHEYAAERLQTLLDEDDGSATDYLSGKHDTLKTLANQLNSTTNTCLKVWDDSPAPVSIASYSPTPEKAAQMDLDSSATPQSGGHQSPDYSFSPSTRTDASSGSMAHASPGDEGAPSLDQLSSRGTGNYTCPHGLGCDKQGVLADGRLKIFKRNCDFADHLRRHERPFHCELPGCNNRKGFARIDQLERHKKQVKHIVPNEWRSSGS